MQNFPSQKEIDYQMNPPLSHQPIFIMMISFIFLATVSVGIYKYKTYGTCDYYLYQEDAQEDYEAHPITLSGLNGNPKENSKACEGLKHKPKIAYESIPRYSLIY